MKIFRDGMIYLLGELISKSIPFLLLPYLAHNLGADGYGELSYYQVIIALGVIVFGFSQEGALTRYYYKYGKRAIGSLLLVSTFHAFIFFTLSLLVFIFLNNTIIFYSLFTAFGQSVLAMFLASQQCQKKPVSYISIQLLHAVSSGVLTVIFFEYVSADTASRILAMMCANFIAIGLSIVVLFSVQNNKVVFQVNRLKLLYKYNFSFGLPLLLHQLSFFAKGQLDRFFIYNIFSAQILGVYSSGYQLASVFSIIIMAINKAVVPYYYDYIKRKKITKVKLRKMFFLSILVCPIPAVFMVLVPENVYIFLLGNEFTGVKYFTVIFTFAISINIPYLFLVNYLFYYGRNGSIAKCTITSSVVYIILVVVLANYDIKLIPCSMILSNIIAITMLYRLIYKED